MNMLRRIHLKVGAPAVVVLAATLVNAAVAGTSESSFRDNASADLSWALQGGATHAARSTRVLMARKAATSIHSLDRLSGAQAVRLSIETADVHYSLPVVSLDRVFFSDHTRSTHQHSAP